MSKRANYIKQETALLPLPGTGVGSGYSPLPKKEGGDEVEKKGKFLLQLLLYPLRSPYLIVYRGKP